MNLFQNEQDIIYLWNLHLSWERKTEEESGSPISVQFSHSVMSSSLLVTPWTVAHQASLSISSWSLLKLMSIESVMPSNHLIPDFRLYYKATVIKTLPFGTKSYRSMEQDKKKPRNTPTYLWSIRETRTYNGEKTISSISGAGKTGQLLVK